MRSLARLVLSPFLLLFSALTLALADLAWLVFGKRKAPLDTACRRDAASVVIPNWNGRDLLERYLPSVIAALEGNPQNEIIVVDNGSSDGSAEFVRSAFPQVKVLAFGRNLGFGGGSNAGFRAARNDIALLLNTDMRVAPDFLAPLLEGFADERVFAVSCQIFFSDPQKRREETGLTQGWWQDGGLKVAIASTPPSTTSFLACTPAAARALSTGASSSSLAASTRCWRPSTWRTPTSAIRPGSAAGRCSISRAAWSITSIAAPSASASAKRRFAPC